MVKYLGERARREGLSNMMAVQGALDSPHLPAKVDLALFVDVYHHIDARPRYFRDLRKSLAPGAHIAIIDFRADSPDGPPRAQRISPEQVKVEMKQAGYALLSEHSFLPRQYFLVFRGAYM